ncbi:MAG: hypothetical protein Ct9H90mP6_04530 [Gammaproteobacteria bacterium]|nr:MAG: hypothetical protein Ct9H90mP6_04530 [Gammaproteobacteria bacterium]
MVPDVYVNETGRVALLLKRYLNAKPEQILVLHDDIDTQIGEAKFKLEAEMGSQWIKRFIKCLWGKILKD